MKNIKAVFFDVDGTLVSFNTHKIPESTLQSIMKLREKGIKVFIATGRNYEAAAKFKELEVDGYVTINGGYCIMSEGKVIHKVFVDEKDKKALFEFQKSNPFPCIVMAENSTYVNYFNNDVEFFVNLLDFPELQVKSLDNMLTDNILQFVLFTPESNDEKMSQILSHCDSQRWHPVFVDYVTAGSNKGVGIKITAQYFGINLEETMVFGDGSNDISMLKAAEIGIAMGNAPDNVKAEADYVTDSVDDDGVMKALQHFGLI